MATQAVIQDRGNKSITRRRFLAVGCMTASWAAMGARTQTVLAADASRQMDIQNIDPGHIGPQFFDKREEEALLEVLESGSPFRYWGPGRPTKVQRFEEGFAEYMGTRFALGVTSGTAALDCAITGLGIGPGDEVILPAYTWWSDYTCVVHAGALPVFADIDHTLNIDPRDFQIRITPRTKAVIAVHLLGGPRDMDPIMETARQHGIAVLEDCAQCVGGSYLTGSELLPIQESVVNKRMRHPDWPSFTSQQGREIQYGPDSCKQTLDVFDRFVQVRVGAKYTQRINDYIIDSIRDVYNSLA